MSSDYPWRAAEIARVEHRRAELAGIVGFVPSASPEDDVGLALSGGGIRSATFCLGLLRALGRASLIPRIDYLSTVSGGGYIGSFLCSMFVPQKRRGDAHDEANAAPPVAALQMDPFVGVEGRGALDHLRQSGRHLMTGGGDAIRIGAIAIRNFVAIHFVIGLTLLTLFLLTKPVKAALLHWDGLLQCEAWAAAQGLSPWFWPSQWLRGIPIGHGILGSFLLYLAAIVLALAALFGSAHWLTQRRVITQSRIRRLVSWQTFGALIGGGAGIVVLIDPNFLTPGWDHVIFLAIPLVLLLIPPIFIYAIAEWLDQRGRRCGNIFSPPIEEDRVRHQISQGMGRLTLWGLVIGGMGVFDTIAQTLYTRYDMLTTGFLSSGAIAAVMITLARRALKALTGAGEGTRFAKLLASSGRLVALVAGLALAILVGTFWAVIAHALAWQGAPIGEYDALAYAGRSWHPIWVLCLMTGIFLAASLTVTRAWDFLNLSSFASFYSGRLRRAYLAASNDIRQQSDGASHKDEDEDDIRLIQYYANDVLAPLHLINVTINDTTGSSSSNLTQRDRRGKPMVISSAGFLYPDGASPASCGRLDFVHPTEKLPLSTWMGISGAAFSTGLGQHGSIGLSLLAGLSNLRLGYWWEANPPGCPRGFGAAVRNFTK
ncbi:MAG: putative esterase of the alpha-beta hydrolase superfamily, partial [Rhizorhabdus sp.]|nr:putative esterase of the alpha-beta hydrolase superfamily [Rhizorhabdus sp.]